MELQDFTMIVRRGYFIDAPSELRLIGPLLNKKEMKELFELIGRDDPYYHPYTVLMKSIVGTFILVMTRN